MEQLGLVGLTNSGKTSLFNALCNTSAYVAPHPYSTTQANIAVAQVPDNRLNALAKMSSSKKIVYAGLEVKEPPAPEHLTSKDPLPPATDHGSVNQPLATHDGLSNKFLAGIREADALCFVLRAFRDENVIGETDPVAALELLELELIMADTASIESQFKKKQKASQSQKTDKELADRVNAMEVALTALSSGTPIYRSELSHTQRHLLNDLFLLTNKPMLVVLNIGDDQLKVANELEDEVIKKLGSSAQVLSLAVQLESEAAQLPEQSKKEILQELGLGEGALVRLSKAAYYLLGKNMFFTTGEKESRAWPYKTGSSAKECAGVIHSDLQRGFIKAEVISCDQLLQAGSWSKAKAEGKIRLEGKDYLVQDGDVMEIRFNV
ncbi:MAG: YchF family ATPase [Actinobacteria bacterium]|nr:YchF family ATPase [Actinomycetota bacterium]MCL6104592.1 YchF family ATPase [Actinomycetota bacterium]